MLNKGIKKYILNPCLGLWPYLLYLFLYNRTGDVQNSLIIAILISAFSEIIIRIYSKYAKTGLLFLATFIALTVSLVVWKIIGDLPSPQRNLYFILPEIIGVIILMIVHLSRKYFFNKSAQDESNMQKVFNHEILKLSSLIQYVFTIHIFIVIVYKFLKENSIIIQPHDTLVYVVTPIIISIFLILYEGFRLKAIANELHTEEWLPIVNEKGDVIDKISKSKTLAMKNKYLNPIVRVALVCNDKLYLQNRDSNDILDPEHLDHPFEKYMRFEHEINRSAQNSILNTLGRELPFKFLLKYTFENENTKRLIFLFVSVINKEEEDYFTKHPCLNGKFWSIREIEESFTDCSQLSECFQLEYEYLKNTVLIPNQINNELLNNNSIDQDMISFL